MGRSKYKDGESVLCYQGLLIYEAKIQGVRKEGQVFQYHIHYKGWNKTWDEWVTEERLLKITSENLLKQKKAEKEVYDSKMKGFVAKKTGGSQAKKASGEKRKSETQEDEGDERKKTKSGETSWGARHNKMRSDSPRSRSNSDASVLSFKSTASGQSDETAAERRRANKTKRKGGKTSNSSQKSESSTSLPSGLSLKPVSKLTGNALLAEAASNPARNQLFNCDTVKIDLPDNLKAVLVDDFDYMMRQRKLSILPNRYTVEDLINAYYESKRGIGTKENSDEAMLGTEETCRGLKDYFNATLGCQLLYKFERIQYSDILKDHQGLRMSQVYGPVHLLRLLTRLGPILSASDIDQQSLNILADHVNDFMGYISRHSETLFQIEDYGTAPPEYHRRAM